MRVKQTVLQIVSGVLCLCISFCGMLAALECTLFKEGFLMEKMQQTSYFSSVADWVSAACQGYATDVGLNTVAVDSFLDRAGIRTDILKNVDARYRGVNPTVPSRFSEMTTTLERDLSAEQGAELTTEQHSVLAVLQISCESTYQEATKPPFDAVLSIVLQYRSYRQWAWIVAVLLGAASFLLMKDASGSPAKLWRALRRVLCSAAASLLLLSAWLGLLVPYRTWMPQENMAYPLFCAWWGGFPTAMAVAGAALLLAALAAGLLCTRKKARAGAVNRASRPAEPDGAATRPVQARAGAVNRTSRAAQPEPDGAAARGAQPRAGQTERIINLSKAKAAPPRK